MRIRPISIAGMSKAVCVTAVLVFLAGSTVPAHEVTDVPDHGHVYLKNRRSQDINFCTHDKDGDDLGDRIEKRKIKSAKCKSLACNTDCFVRRCKFSNKIDASVGDYHIYPAYGAIKATGRKPSGCP